MSRPSLSWGRALATTGAAAAAVLAGSTLAGLANGWSWAYVYASYDRVVFCMGALGLVAGIFLAKPRPPGFEDARVADAARRTAPAQAAADPLLGEREARAGDGATLDEVEALERLEARSAGLLKVGVGLIAWTIVSSGVAPALGRLYG